jgi:citrate lyase subunit beta/citryl-CoA lyase
MKTPSPRSYLFVPGDRPERFAKALASGADSVILDLEDAVLPARKEAARDAIVAWERSDAATGGAAGGVIVRINGADTPWFADDLAALAPLAADRAGAASVLGGVMLPKADGPDAIAAVRSRLPAGGGVETPALIALVETVAGIIRLRELAAARGLTRLAFGSVDLCVDAGILGDGEELHYIRSRLVLESRFAGLAAPIDGVSLALDDADALAKDVARARRFGFGAKLCIHPKQVAAVNAGFSPSEEEIAWAQRVLAAIETGGGRGAVAVDGKLVDKPVIDRAQAILSGRGAGGGR